MKMGRWPQEALKDPASHTLYFLKSLGLRHFIYLSLALSLNKATLYQV